MKIHLKQIPADGLHLEGEEDCPIAELEAEGAKARMLDWKRQLQEAKEQKAD